VNSKTAPQTAKADVYARVTDRIVEDLAAGVRPWMKPWSAGHADGRISRPLRHNGTRYKIGDLVELSTSEFWHLRRLGVVIDEASVG